MKLIAICFSDVSTKIDGKWKYIVAAEWFEQILEGIKAAHQLGIIHRDLKPENLLITRNEKNQPLAKILDFGLAKVTLFDAPPSVSLTGPGTLLGTIYYMSPEQIVGGDVDERTDIFSLGMIAVEALTGERPFTGKSSTDIALAIIQKPFAFEELSEELTQLNAVIQKSLAKDRNKRFVSVTEMQEELIPAIRNCPPFPPPDLSLARRDPAATNSIEF